MVERIMEDYHGAFAHGFDESRDIEEPEPVRRVAKKAATASWKSLAVEDLEGTRSLAKMRPIRRAARSPTCRRSRGPF
jgi:hypothetical protein